MSGTDDERTAEDEGTTDDETADALATVASGGALVFGGQVVALGLGFLTQLAMARLLTETGYGRVVLTIAVVNIVQLVAMVGLDDGVMRLIPAHEGDLTKVRGTARAGLLLSAAFGLLWSAGLFVFAPTVATRIFSDPALTPLIRIGAFGVPFAVAGHVAVSVARGARDARPYAYINQLLNPSVRFALIVLFLFAGWGAVGAVGGQIAANALAGIVALGFTYRILSAWEASPASMHRPLLAFSLPLVLMQGMNFLLANTDTFLIGFFLSAGLVGVYNIAFQLYNILGAMTTPVGYLLPPMLTRLEAEDNESEMVRVYQIATKWIVFLTLPVFFTLFLFPELVISTLFGKEYAGGALPLQTLALGSLLANLMGVNKESMVAVGRNRLVSAFVALQTFLNVALNVFLIPEYGILGAAIASSIAVVFVNLANTGILYRDFGIFPFRASTLRPVAVTSLFAAGVHLAVQFGGLSRPVGAVLAVPGYAVLFVSTATIETAERRLLARSARRLGVNPELVTEMLDRLSW